ncbi:MAG: hypothetical protein HUU41_23220 [Bryobacteraceae bacterium]|nr:hypothetical protein [Bryobacteraceae bacterium]
MAFPYRYMVCGRFTEAGLFGESFGLFNAVASVIVAVALVYQVHEFRESSRSTSESIGRQDEAIKQNAEHIRVIIDNSYLAGVHERNSQELGMLRAKAFEYRLKFEEAILRNPARAHGVCAVTVGFFGFKIQQTAQRFAQIFGPLPQGVTPLQLPPSQNFGRAQGLALFNSIDADIDLLEQRLESAYRDGIKALPV